MYGEVGQRENGNRIYCIYYYLILNRREKEKEKLFIYVVGRSLRNEDVQFPGGLIASGQPYPLQCLTNQTFELIRE